MVNDRPPTGLLDEDDNNQRYDEHKVELKLVVEIRVGRKTFKLWTPKYSSKHNLDALDIGRRTTKVN